MKVCDKAVVQIVEDNRSPMKAVSEMGQFPTAGSSGNYLNNQADYNSSQGREVVKGIGVVTHKTPQIKPSVPGLSMPADPNMLDTYSNDDGGNNKQNGQVFALPLVGKRRRSTVGIPKQA